MYLLRPAWLAEARPPPPPPASSVLRKASLGEAAETDPPAGATKASTAPVQRMRGHRRRVGMRHISITSIQGIGNNRLTATFRRGRALLLYVLTERGNHAFTLR